MDLLLFPHGNPNKWHEVYRCRSCSHEGRLLIGCCPHCGHGDSFSYKKVKRRMTTPWWKFWAKPKYEYKDE
jgi:predicted ATP-dependent serine protease